MKIYKLVAIKRGAHAFTMAEILISLTIIGVIAAITLPSLKANINEKIWATQRKALYSRMSQAIAMLPSLNGYGVGATQADTNEKAAAAFVTDGLSKILKINNICDSTHLKDCGIVSKFTTMGNSKINFPTTLKGLALMYTFTSLDKWGKTYSNPQPNSDTKVTAFETENGESIALFYNPNCVNKDTVMYSHDNNGYFARYIQPYLCANFIYDLNGIKGPNKVGKDIGFITSLYSTESEVVAPMPLNKNVSDSALPAQAAILCKKQNDSRLPNADELTAMAYNDLLLNLGSKVYVSSTIWNPTNITTEDTFNNMGNRWLIQINTGIKGLFNAGTANRSVRCVKR